MIGTDSYRCRCGRRLLVTASPAGPGTVESCVRCMKSTGDCRCDDLVTDPDGWGEVAYFPRGKYRIVEDDEGWSVEIQDDRGSFS